VFIAWIEINPWSFQIVCLSWDGNGSW